jgi:RNA polymerase sigma factor (sigma-70 family)
MATGEASEVIRHLRRTVLLRGEAGLTDGELLESFLSRRDGAAMEVLVRRHAPMVWGVCHRVLGNHHNAQDAFQATFLVLVRRAASIASRELLANWLYGVAHLTALKARATTAKRKGRERQVTVMPEPAVADQDVWDDLRPLLDQELSRLPENSRAVIVLCDLEGKTRQDVARQLGLPEGTVASRLARARAMLAKRLTQRGVTLSGGSLAAVLLQKAASASAPISVLSSTIKAATLLASGSAAAAGQVSVTVASLAEGVVKTMLVSKLKVATAVLLAAGIATLAASRSGLPALATEPPPPSRTGRPATQEGGKRQTALEPVIMREVIMREDALVPQLAWSPDGKVVATVGVNSRDIELRDEEGKRPRTLGFPFTTVKIWDARIGKVKKSLGTEKAQINDIAFSPDRKTAAMVVLKFPEKMYSVYVQRAGKPPAPSAKQEVRLVDAETWALKRTVPTEAGVQSLAFSPDGKTLAFGGNSHQVVGGSYVKLWDVQNERIKGGTKFAERMVMAVRDGGVSHLTYSADGKLLAAGDRHGAVRLFDGQTGELKQVLEAHSDDVRGIAFVPDGQTLVSVTSPDKTYRGTAFAPWRDSPNPMGTQPWPQPTCPMSSTTWSATTCRRSSPSAPRAVAPASPTGPP